MAIMRLLWVCGFLLAAADYTAPSYSVDLDQPAQTRWVHIYPQYKELMLEVVSTALSELNKVEVFLLAQALKLHYLDEDLKGEIKGCAEFLGIEFDDLAVVQFLYEMENGCTSIVYRQVNGTIIHGRNLDFPYAPLLRQMVINIDFYRGTNYVYTATTFPGYFGVISGSKPGSFSVSVDERYSNDSSTISDIWTFVRNLFGLVTMRSGDTFAIRKALERYQTWQEAVHYLATAPVVAPTYYIIGGLSANEGAVVTRNRWDTANYWFLNSTAWFLVETNYDHWKPQPPSDDRADAAIHHMAEIGQANMDIPAFYSVFSAPPVLQANLTVYTSLMSPATGFYTTIARENATSLD